MTTTESELNTLFAQVYAAYAVPLLADNEFTIRQFAEAQNITTARATPMIDRAVADGLLEEVGNRRDGRHVAKAYRRRPDGGAAL